MTVIYGSQVQTHRQWKVHSPFLSWSSPQRQAHHHPPVIKSWGDQSTCKHICVPVITTLIAWDFTLALICLPSHLDDRFPSLQVCTTIYSTRPLLKDTWVFLSLFCHLQTMLRWLRRSHIWGSMQLYPLFHPGKIHNLFSQLTTENHLGDFQFFVWQTVL